MEARIVEEVNHQRIKTNGIWLHVAEKGSSSGPLVLLLHGFPDFWYSWRHQITFLADRGYHVVAPDLRGCGDSDAPISHTSYSILHIVGDILGLLDHFGAQQAFVVGHDWGALAAWYLSIFRPERVKGLIALSVPFYQRNPEAKVIESFRKIYGQGFYICQFQDPGRAEQAFARYDYLTVMKKFLLINKPDDNLVAPMGMEIIDYLETPAVLPPWITEDELQVYADKFQESGFTGPLNYYRAMDLNWEISAPWQGSKVTVPAKFMVGNEDIGFRTSGTKQYIEGDTFRSFVPDLEVVVVDGHHFIHQEKAQQVSEEIAAFLHKHSSQW
ncbi:Epoxide hydrolase A, partial [Linum grandiflorum]